jgi:uncharacterized protein (TIGR03083 family)
VGDDWEARYEGVRRRIVALVDAHPRIVDVRLPACPAWTGRDLLGHLVGVASDLAACDVDGYASEAWTQRQVKTFRQDSVADLLALWDRAARGLRVAPPVASVPAIQLAVGDAIAHEADLLGALTSGLRVPDPDVSVAIQMGVARWRPVLAAASLPPLQIAVPGLRVWWLGRDDGRAVRLEVPGYELFRLLYGRRSRDQVSGLGWSSEPRPYLDAGLPFPFRWADHALED